MPKPNELELKHCFAYIADDGEAKAINEDDQTIDFVISSSVIDRDDEIVEVQAMADAVLKGAFKDNPVALACHQHRLSDGMPPVVGSWQIDTFRQLARTCQMRLQFASETILGGQYWMLYKARHMRAVSIGFRTLDSREEVQNGKRIRIITRLELFEISCVPVPANPQALAKYKSGFDDTTALEALLKNDTTLEEQYAFNEKEVRKIFDRLEEKLDTLLAITAQSDAYAESLASFGDETVDLSGPAGDDGEKSEQQATPENLTIIQKMLTDVSEKL